MLPGQKVVVVTTRKDVEEAAATTLGPRSLALQINRVETIREGDVEFLMYFSEIVAR